MTKGAHLSYEAKSIIKALYQDGSPIDFIWATITKSYGADYITYRHLQRLVSVLRNGIEEEIAECFPPTPHPRSSKRAKRSDNLTEEEMDMLISMRREYVSMTYKALRVRFLSALGVTGAFMSEEDLRDICAKNGLSKKVLEFRHCKQNPNEQLAYVQCVQHMPKSQFVSIDGMVQSAKDYHARHGYASKGQRAVQNQVVIRSKPFAVMLACTVDGIIAYQIFEGNVGAIEIGYFIEHRLAPKLFRNHFAILDNARNQNNESVRALLDDAFEGLYCFLAPYSPSFAPVENVIELVKGHVRTNEIDATKSELQLLIDALEYYSVGNEGAKSVAGCFNLYGTIHEHFLREIEQA
jgi:hypothetical protein